MAKQYRGYEIRSAERRFRHGIYVRGVEVERDGRILSFVHDDALARHVVDVMIQQGRWQEG